MPPGGVVLAVGSRRAVCNEIEPDAYKAMRCCAAAGEAVVGLQELAEL